MDVHRIAGLELHAERHFILRDARQRFRIAETRVGLLVDGADGIEHLAAQRPTDARRVMQIQHGLALRTTLHALIHTRQIP